MNIYSVKDTRTGEFAQPFFTKHDTQAVRIFAEAVKTDDANNMLFKYPRDFTLHKVGTWNNETGELSGYTEPQPIITGDSAKRYYDNEDGTRDNPNG